MEDLTGKRFGRLTVIGRDEYVGKSSFWLCRCDCGNLTSVRGGKLKDGGTKSCGCYRHECLTKQLKKHGCSKNRLYNIWTGMKQRCSNENSDSWNAYGERGIKVCDEWKESFVAFREWALSHGYSDDLTIDRIDADGNYEPSNCRWATIRQQANNKRNSSRIEINGIIKSLPEWCDIYKIKTVTAWRRIRNGWNPIDAFTIPTNVVWRGKYGDYNKWKNNSDWYLQHAIKKTEGAEDGSVHSG